jgi:hypothetical protein
VFRGSRGADRRPSTLQLGHDILPSTHIRHSTNRPVHQSQQSQPHRQKDEAPDEAHVIFFDSRVTVILTQPFPHWLEVGISCRQSDWQLSLAQVCGSSFLALIPTVEHLYIEGELSQLQCWQDDVENSQWLELLHPFTAVKNLFLSQEFAPRIAPALQELAGERASEVLPALQSIFLEGLHQSGVVSEEIGQFVNARHLSGHTTAVIPWTREDE